MLLSYMFGQAIDQIREHKQELMSYLSYVHQAWKPGKHGPEEKENFPVDSFRNGTLEREGIFPTLHKDASHIYLWQPWLGLTAPILHLCCLGPSHCRDPSNSPSLDIKSDWVLAWVSHHFYITLILDTSAFMRLLMGEGQSSYLYSSFSLPPPSSWSIVPLKLTQPAKLFNKTHKKNVYVSSSYIFLKSNSISQGWHSLEENKNTSQESPASIVLSSPSRRWKRSWVQSWSLRRQDFMSGQLLQAPVVFS